MQKFATPAAVSVVLDIPAGRIQVIAADRADTTVEVLPSNAAKSRDVKAAEETDVAFADGVVRIVCAPPARNKLFGPSGSVEVTVQVPAGSGVEAKAGGAEFRGVGRLGDVVVDGGLGTVKIDEAASARLAVLDGDVVVGRLGGSADVSTQRGGIDIAEAVGGAVVLRTLSGDIAIAAAPGVSAALDAGTTQGRIRNSLKNTDGADAVLAIQATTMQGDITARGL
ncbi:DUF4097 family beta strand repeat-containing protein [Yinghuangia aomiensis]|uniref:DUF4097 family beta strand repeat-containing protein n=1 Tax=Yinghuangia aomiensis TaxID=676205 RepID=A0ABP9HXE4_9ACTN